jgi:hypothetical protein
MLLDVSRSLVKNGIVSLIATYVSSKYILQMFAFSGHFWDSLNFSKYETVCEHF